MDLPNRPRVLPGLPVLRRRDGAVQIGTDPRHAMLVEQVPPPTADALLDLTGGRTLPELLADAPSLVRLLRGLTLAGLVEETVPAPHGRLIPETTSWALRTRRPAHHLGTARAARSVVVHGDGRLTIAVATLLASAGVGHVRVVARGRVGAEDTGSGYVDADVGRLRAEAAQDALRRASASVRTSPKHPDLVVLADALVPQPDLPRQLVMSGTPHLVVRAREGLGVVGPLVVPGRSSCLRCADLHRAELDESWPMIAAQLADRAWHADLATTTATAGLAVGQALLALDHEGPSRTRPPTWDATLEVDAFAGGVEHRIAPVHERCECRSAGL